MAKRMLIDATHPEETRVVVVNGTRLEQLDVETSTKKQLKGNIYLAKIVRVEPSLQAAFVEYGGNRHGFLAFSEIHPDYYQIPVADREALMREQAAEQEDNDNDGEDDVETLGGDDAEDVSSRSRSRSSRNYKIQEVIKRRQILLVQVVKEERGNKGAALTTFLSLAGRYCVLMPNTARGGGVSRKITSITDRKRLKSIMSELEIPPSMAVILRTAGQERSKAEIKRDYEYLMRTWNQIRDTTLESMAPALIYEEANLIRRAIRDVYTSDIEEVLVEGDEGYRLAKDFMKLLTPSHAKKVQPYKEVAMPLYHRYQVDSQLDAMHSPTVQLKSGGYIVINQTEALVAIDVNSGRSTKERHIEETAIKTNLEAADEVARQLRLRDLAGLIVIDFIDMEESRNNASVERRLKDALKLDRARIQMGRISHFGLMELSRQRLRPSLMETSFETCPHCAGAGMVRSVESAAMHILRVIEEEGVRRRSGEITVHVATPVALYILNNKRRALADIEARYTFTVYLRGDDSLISPDHRMDRVKAAEGMGEDVVMAPLPAPTPVEDKVVVEAAEVVAQQPPVSDENSELRGRRKRRKRRRRSGDGSDMSEATLQADDSTDTEGSDDAAEANDANEFSGETDTTDSEGETKRRRRSRRGGRRRRRGGEENAEQAAPQNAGDVAVTAMEPADEQQTDSSEDVTDTAETTAVEAAAGPVSTNDRVRRRRVRRKRGDDVIAGTVVEDAPVAVANTEGPADVPSATPVEHADVTTPEAVAVDVVTVEVTTEERAPVEKPKRRRTRKTKAEIAAEEAAAQAAVSSPVETTPVAITEAAPAPVASEPAKAPVPEAAPMAPEADKPVEVIGAKPDEPEKPRRGGWWQRLTS